MPDKEIIILILSCISGYCILPSVFTENETVKKVFTLIFRFSVALNIAMIADYVRALAS